jgi:hypothetical protein
LAGRPRGEIFLLLQAGPAGDGLAVRAGEHIVGTLSRASSAVYAAAMAAGQSAHQPVVVEAAVRRTRTPR